MGGSAFRSTSVTGRRSPFFPTLASLVRRARADSGRTAGPPDDDAETAGPAAEPSWDGALEQLEDGERRVVTGHLVMTWGRRTLPAAALLTDRRLLLRFGNDTDAEVGGVEPVDFPLTSLELAPGARDNEPDAMTVLFTDPADPQGLNLFRFTARDEASSAPGNGTEAAPGASGQRLLRELRRRLATHR